LGEPPPARERVSNGALFVGFLKIGLSGFGGVLPFARRMLVEQRRWLTEQEFTEVLSLAQFLPGPNVVNASVIVGRRFQGPIGAVVAPLGLMLMPLVIVLALAALFAEFADVEAVRGACRGVSAAASGLVLATALKMSEPIRRTGWQLAVGAVVFVAIALARVSMLWVLAVLVPVSLGIAWRKRP
jgi:chromate transporter